jgi:thiol-disulfide isomerase/thioredoxin
MPSLNALYNKLKDDDRFVFLFINEDENASKAKAYLQNNRYAFPFVTRAGNIPTEIFSGTLPTTVILNKEGNVVMKHEGLANYNADKFLILNFIQQFIMKNIFIIPAAALLISLAACSDSKMEETKAQAIEVLQTSIDNTAAAGLRTTSVLPAFTVQDVNGNTINLQHFKGKKLFVNLWASWCPPCRAEMPSIEKLFRSVDTSKVVFVMLSLDDHFDKAKKFIGRQRLNLPIYYPAENLPALFNVQAIPATFIFNESGDLIQRIDGSDDYNRDEYRKLLQ